MIDQQVARWKIRHDPVATRNCYTQMPIGSGCDCSPCRNFNAAVSLSFPPEFFELAEALGLDPAKPAELCHYEREPSGRYVTNGWFHLVGSLIEIVGGKPFVDPHGFAHFSPLVSGVEIGLTARDDLAHKAFEGFQLLELDFLTRVPWVLDEPEPEAPLSQ